MTIKKKRKNPHIKMKHTGGEVLKRDLNVVLTGRACPCPPSLVYLMFTFLPAVPADLICGCDL